MSWSIWECCPPALIRSHLGSCSIFMHAAGKMKRSPSPPVVERPGGEPLAPADGRKGAAGLVWAVEGAEPRVSQNRVKKQLRMSAARWLCSGHRSERSAWLHHYARDLLTPARCAELPPTAREAGQHWPRRRSFPSKMRALPLCMLVEWQKSEKKIAQARVQYPHMLVEAWGDASVVS